MEATRPISPEDSKLDLRGHAPAEPRRGSVPSPKQTQSLPPAIPGAAESEDPDAGRPISTEAVHAAVVKLRDYVQSLERSLKFSVDEDSGRTVIKVMDADTDEVIRQIPSSETLNILRHITESGEDGAKSLPGFLLREEA